MQDYSCHNLYKFAMPSNFSYNTKYLYKEFKDMPPEEKYLFISVKYLNGEGFIITSFFTNKITGLK